MNAATALIGVALLGVALSPLPAQAASEREWRFEVFLDDKPIGFHRFRLESVDGAHRLLSEARFRVKVLGFTVYDYTHRSDELWREDCLRRIDASTDDNGKDLFVRGSARGESMRLESHAGTTNLEGCVMTFAYWNPGILGQDRLLNVQTGEYLQVDVRRLGAGTLDIRGDALPALRYRLDTDVGDIELWYSDDRDWLALSSTTQGGRQLHYRRVPATDTENKDADD
jgi:hypothetical protein